MRPILNRIQCWRELTAHLCQRIHLTRLPGRTRGPFDQPAMLKLLEPSGQKPVRKLRDCSGNFTEPHGTFEQNADDCASPTPTNKLNGLLVNGAAHDGFRCNLRALGCCGSCGLH